MRLFCASLRLTTASLVCSLTMSAMAANEPALPGNTNITQIPSIAFFEKNEGQYHHSVDYIYKSDRLNAVIQSGEPAFEVFSYTKNQNNVNSQQHALSNGLVSNYLALDFIDAQPVKEPTLTEKNLTLINHISGNDKSKWFTNMPTFNKLRYLSIYPDIDLEYYFVGEKIEFDFILAPGSNPSAIKIKYNNAENLFIDKNGNLNVTLPNSNLVFTAPVSYQEVHGVRQPIDVQYVVDNYTVSFDVKHYDPKLALVIDPIVEYSSYFGGPARETSEAIGIDSDDNIYVVGLTRSAGLATPSAFQQGFPPRNTTSIVSTCADCSDVDPATGQVTRTIINAESSIYVNKFSADGRQLLFTTYINGQGFERLGINSVAVNSNGELAFGVTRNAPPGLPSINSTQSHNENQENVYIAKLATDGANIIFGTYLQIAELGMISSILRGVDMSPDGKVVVAGGAATGNNFPEVNPIIGQSCQFDTAGRTDTMDGFVALFSAMGTLEFSSCYGGRNAGGSQLEFFRGVDFDSNGHINLLGYSSMLDFPLVNPFQSSPSYPGSRDMTIVQIDADTRNILYSTYFGPTQFGRPPADFFSQTLFPADIVTDSSGNIIVTGTTNELFFPVHNPAYPNLAVPTSSYGFFSFFKEEVDAYLTKINPTTNELIFSTYLGGSRAEDGLHALALDQADNIYLSQITRSSDYPVVSPIQSAANGSTQLALTKFTSDGKVSFSTYFGGSNDNSFQTPGGIEINSSDQIILGYDTRSLDFPVTASALQPLLSGDRDATLSIIDQSMDIDTDGDGVIDGSDAFPMDTSEWRDTDNDGTGDVMDTDDDGDNTLDINDRFPLNFAEQVDSDNDGVGDNADLYPNDSSNIYDFDGDTVGDFSDNDSDNDNISNDNEDDEFVFDPTESADTDGDGIGDNADLDSDGDGVLNADDIAPLDDSFPIITFNSFDPLLLFSNPDPLPRNFNIPDQSDSLWTIASDRAFSGFQSLGTVPMSNNQSALLEYNTDFEPGLLSFFYMIDSEPDQDELIFNIDADQQFAVSGNTGWVKFETSINNDQQLLTWQYNKNTSISMGLDAAWIDDFFFNTRIGDPAISLSNSVSVIPGGQQVEYLITINNAGPSDASRIIIVADIPAELQNATWTCAGSNGNVCPQPSGSGAINERLDVLDESSITYTLTADVPVDPEVPVTFIAELLIPSIFDDTNPNNNQAIDIDHIGLFGSGFE